MIILPYLYLERDQDYPAQETHQSGTHRPSVCEAEGNRRHSRPVELAGREDQIERGLIEAKTRIGENWR